LTNPQESYSKGLQKTQQGLTRRLLKLFGEGAISASLAEEIEEILLASDMGVMLVQDIMDKLKMQLDREGRLEQERIMSLLKEMLLSELEGGADAGLKPPDLGPTVYLIVGVNGVGKTTAIGKMAAGFKSRGKKVLLAASDTFRAAAIEQLEIWAQRSGAELVKHQPGGDAAAVAYDACAAARARGMDALIVDTAGRLHTKHNLMEELEKIKRVLKKHDPALPHETLLVMDATTGQNGLSQCRIFKEHMDITGIILAKLDGTAKGGIVFAIHREFGVPVKLVGTGEGIEDLEEFNASEFVEALFQEPSQEVETVFESIDEEKRKQEEEIKEKTEKEEKEKAEKKKGKTKKPKRSRWPLIAAAVFVLLIGGVAGSYFYYQHWLNGQFRAADTLFKEARYQEALQVYQELEYRPLLRAGHNRILYQRINRIQEILEPSDSIQEKEAEKTEPEQ
jgi:fused signal recognition particle receptor